MAKQELVLNRGLKFGIELEVVTSRRRTTIVKALQDAGIRVVGEINFGHTVVNGWKVVTDSSISRGFEIVSPPINNFEDVKIVCEVLKNLDVKVDKSCGFHVHHEASDLNKKDIENVYKLYDKYEAKVIDELLPMSRRGGNSQWCKPIKELISEIERCESIEDMINHRGIGGGRGGSHYAHCRYRSVNFRAYVVYGTLEFRHHSGTIDFEKIKNWVLLTHKFLETAKEIKKVKKVSEKRMIRWNEDVKHSSYDMYMELGISGTELSKYLGKRRKALKRA